MNKILYLIVILLIFFIFGCNKEETDELESITAQAIDNNKLQIIKSTNEDLERYENSKEEIENIKTVRLCHDTDNGIVRWVNGSIFGYYDNATRFEFNDFCKNFNYLTEFYCENNMPLQRRFLCINGCVDNHCL